MNLSVALFIIMGLASVWMLYRIQKMDDRFDVSDFLMTRGRADPHKVLLLMAGMVSTWAVFHLALAFKLTETIFGLYLGGFVVNAGVQKAVGLIKEEKGQTP